MNSDMVREEKWNKVTQRRGEMLDCVAAGEKSQPVQFYGFHLFNPQTLERTGNNYRPLVEG